MSSGVWNTTTLGVIAEIVMGQSPSGDTCNEAGDGIPLLNGPTEFGNNNPSQIQFTTDPKKIAEEGDLLFCVRGSTTGRMNWADQKYAIGRGLAALRHRSGYSFQPFLKGIIDSYLPLLLAEATGSTFPNVSSQQLNNLTIEVPDLHTQRRIADILSALDEKIELNRQTNATLEAIAHAIFKEWFVDFRFPGATGEMQDSELGPIPRGWRAGRIGDICELNPKLTLRKGAISKYVEMKNLSQCLLSIEEPREREFVSGSKFQNGDTLFARIAPCLENGKTGFVDFLADLEIGWGSTEFIVLRGRNYINPYFIYCLSRLSNFREFAIQSMVGSSGRQRVVESILSDYPTVIPDQETVNNFLKVVEQLFFQVKNNSDQSATVAKIRDALLPKLMSGEIEV